MSDTPRTDAETLDVEVEGDAYTRRVPYTNGCGDYVPADFARTLERELAQEKAHRLIADITGEKLVAELARVKQELAQAVAERDDLLEWQEKWRKATSESDKRTNDLFVSMSSQLDRAFAERDAALAQVRESSELVESYEDALRNICLIWGFDPSEGEGTSGEEVFKITERNVKAERADAAKLREALEKIAALSADSYPSDWQWAFAMKDIALAASKGNQ